MSATDPPGGEPRQEGGEPRQKTTRQEGPRQNGEHPGELSEDRRHQHVAKPRPWRVFLSHTSELRQHPGPGNSYVDRAERAVSAAGHTIADMADFPSADQPPASLCAETVGECDVYVGIFGLRYGSPVRDRPEVSYTELEFNTATEKGLPRLVFLVDSDSGELGLPPKAMIDREYGDRQDAFLQRVSDGGLLTVQRFRNPDHLALLVERSLRKLEQRSASASPQPAQPSRGSAGWSWPTAWEFRAYREAKRRDFVGRAWLFEEVRAWATDPSPNATQALLIGADYGVGKSAFLAELIDNAHQGKGQDSHGPGIPIGAQHFCTTEQDATLTAELFVRSVAAQLAGALPAYRQALEADGASERRRWLDEAAQDPERAFDQAVLAPLLAIDPAPPPQLLVVDALDEAQDPRSSGGPATQQTIVHLLARYANRLPPWLKLLAPSRRRPDVHTPLRQAFSLKELNAEEARNLADLRAYAEARCQASPLAERLQEAHLSASEVAEFLSGKQQSGGKFLYVVRVLKDLETGLLPLSGRADLEALPPGMDGFYCDAFERRFPSTESYALARRILGVLCEQREPLGRRELAALLGCAERQIAESLRPLHDLLRLQAVTTDREGATAKEVVHSFDHLSLPQWLSEEDEWLQPRAGRFAVDRSAAAERLRAWAQAEVEAGRAHTWPYLVRHLASHLTAAERPGVMAGLLGELAWLEARLRLAGINALLGDFAVAAPSPWLGRLERALRQGAHVLSHSEGWLGQEQLASQVLARLADEGEEAERLRGQAVAWLHKAGGAPPLAASLVAQDALLRTLPVGSVVNALAVLPDGRLAAGSQDNTIRLWDPATGSCSAVFKGHQRGVNALAVLPDGRLASGSQDNTIRLWDPATDSCYAVFEGHQDGVRALAVLPDGRLVSGSWDNTIRLWDPATGSCERVFEGHQRWVMALAVLHDGRIASGSWDNSIRIWDPNTGFCSATFKGLHEDDGVMALALLPNGSLAIGFWKHNTIILRDPAIGTCSASFAGHQDGVNALAVLPNGLLASGSDDRTIRLWDPAAGFCCETSEALQVMSMAVLPGELLACGSVDSEIRLWDLARGSCSAAIEGRQDGVIALAVLPNGLLASGSPDSSICLSDPATGFCSATFEEQLQDGVNALAVLPDGLLVCGSCDKTIRIWDPATGTCSASFAGHQDGVNALAVLPNGLLASGSSDQTIRLWDPATGSCSAIFEGQAPVRALAVLPDERLASGSDDDTIRLWDPATGSCSAVFKGHQAPVNALAVLPDGRLASGSWDNTIRLWDPARPDGAPQVLFVADAAISALIVRPTRPLLVAGDGSGRLHWLELPSGH
ncbi:MAG: DUF4062 domain-containing protein [Cyanobacteriota bacterium]